MSSFDIGDLEGYNYTERRPTVSDELLKSRILGSLFGGGYSDRIRVRVGSVWDRKGYPQAGSLSHDVDPSPYRTRDDQTYISIDLLLDAWDTSSDAALVDVLNDVREEQKLEHRRVQEGKKQAKLDRARELRDEAEKLEAEDVK